MSNELHKTADALPPRMRRYALRYGWGDEQLYALQVGEKIGREACQAEIDQVSRERDELERLMIVFELAAKQNKEMAEAYLQIRPFHDRVACDICRGAGTIGDDLEICKSCDGYGINPEVVAVIGVNSVREFANWCLDQPCVSLRGRDVFMRSYKLHAAGLAIEYADSFRAGNVSLR